MKMIIEVSGGTVQSITATADCEIYLIDHDNMQEMGWNTTTDKLEAMQPDCVTNEGGHVAFPGASETPEFDAYLDEALSEYDLHCCGICGGEHPVGFEGDCRDDANRYPQAAASAFDSFCEIPAGGTI
jgi:GMP synthase-like glutamine amidotransferase